MESEPRKLKWLVTFILDDEETYPSVSQVTAIVMAHNANTAELAAWEDLKLSPSKAMVVGVCAYVNNMPIAIYF